MPDSDGIRGDHFSKITGSFWSPGREPFLHLTRAKKKGPEGPKLP